MFRPCRTAWGLDTWRTGGGAAAPKVLGSHTPAVAPVSPKRSAGLSGLRGRWGDGQRQIDPEGRPLWIGLHDTDTPAVCLNNG